MVSEASQSRPQQTPPSPAADSHTSVFFIIDGPRLIAQAYLLAASIRRHRQPGQTFIAYHRQDAPEPLPDLLRDALERSGIEIRPIPGTATGDVSPWSTPYPVGNKILAAQDDRPGEISVFLDTDTVLVRPVDFRAALGSARAGAVISDYRTIWPGVEGWKPVFAHFGIPLPAERPGVLRRPSIDYPPYFNAGMVIFRNGPMRAGQSFGACWMAMCRELDRAGHLSYSRLNMDQIVLSLMFGDPGIGMQMIQQRYNYNIMAWGEPAPDAADIVHYHHVGRLWRAQRIGTQAAGMLRDLLDEPELQSVAAQYPGDLRWGMACKRLSL